eukprot:4675561-Alexandrium_andersonii.AAC.1
MCAGTHALSSPCAPAGGTKAEREHTRTDAGHGCASEYVERLEYPYVNTGAPEGGRPHREGADDAGTRS